ncbi:LysM domain-containing protein [Anaerosphaera aminiphila DSM 21120]|uniref:LysM domain-containing protein n=1 Tax=Anaerosphaera aminiphila DSM 21120 TaxID=1120995 RepID=A0A1M5NXR4_9FIRM|nr:LysM peptidoglycan-binding domain-containing protein [Anaerosphaera aminiphila]SHG93969.1 LysM domain-containing protein [Anaerosphaera aminiphila DSM 21120]
MNKKIYLNKFRCIVFLLVIFIFGTGVQTTNLSNYFSDENINEVQSYTYYTVKKNDTIWSIVSDNFAIKRDKRDYVNLITDLNDITTDIYPGQTIIIPNDI